MADNDTKAEQRRELSAVIGTKEHSPNLLYTVVHDKQKVVFNETYNLEDPELSYNRNKKAIAWVREIVRLGLCTSSSHALLRRKSPIAV